MPLAQRRQLKGVTHALNQRGKVHFSESWSLLAFYENTEHETVHSEGPTSLKVESASVKKAPLSPGVATRGDNVNSWFIVWTAGQCQNGHKVVKIEVILVAISETFIMVPNRLFQEFCWQRFSQD